MDNRTYVIDVTVTKPDETYPIYFDITRIADRISCTSKIDDGPWNVEPVNRNEAAKILNNLRGFRPIRTDWSW